MRTEIWDLWEREREDRETERDRDRERGRGRGGERERRGGERERGGEVGRERENLKCSDPSSYQAEALQWQEQNLQKRALLQLVLALHPNQHSTIRPNQTTQLQKQNYIAYCKDATKIQKKMELYLQLNRDYKPAEYLSCVKHHKLIKTLTKYRLSDHCLNIERGRHR